MGILHVFMFTKIKLYYKRYNIYLFLDRIQGTKLLYWNDSFKRVFLLYPMRSMGESIGIGLEASSTSKGPQAKATEPMDSV